MSTRNRKSLSVADLASLAKRFADSAYESFSTENFDPLGRRALERLRWSSVALAKEEGPHYIQVKSAILEPAIWRSSDVHSCSRLCSRPTTVTLSRLQFCVCPPSCFSQ